MYRFDKETGWLLYVGPKLLAVVLLIHLAACSGGTSKNLVVTGITPATVPATGGQISFSGYNFTSDTLVTIGGVNATVFYGGPTLLTAQAPANKTPGAVNVVVSSPSAGTSVTLSGALTYQAAPTVPPVSNTPICTGSVCIYEAENPQSTLTGGSQIVSCSGCSGGMKVGDLGGSAYVTINDISAPATGTYTLNIYGVDGDGTGSSGRNFTVSVNGGSAQTVNIVGPSWGATSPVQTMQVSLNQGGSNSIEFGDPGNYAPDLDYIVISPNTQAAAPACTSAICVYDADSPSNTLVAPAQVVGCSGCVTGYKVGGYDLGSGSLTLNNVYAQVAGTYNLTIYGVGGGGSRTVTIDVNGSNTQSATISGNNGNSDSPPVTIQVQLNQGSNVLKFYTLPDNYSPQLDYFVVSPQAQWTPIGSGAVQINYDLNTGLASFVYDGSTIISNFYSQVMLGGTQVQSTSGSYTRQITTGSNGETEVTLTASDGTPTMVQRFILVNNNYLLMQVELVGANGATLSSNQMSPIVTSMPKSITLPTVSDPRFLMVPFDNDSFSTYNDASVYNSLDNANSYEVGVFHDGGTRNALVVGSVTHDTWKTGIIANSAYGNFALDTLNVVGGFGAPEDQLPHGAVTGTTIASPTVMVGFYSDWRDGLEAYANANAQVAPMLAWSKPAPVGWSSWGKIQSTMSESTALEDANYFHTDLPNFNNLGQQYLNLDANTGWTDTASQQFNAATQAQGQTVGNYWTPWVWWNSDNPLSQSDLSSLVEGSTYTYGDIVMRDPYGNPLRLWDGAYALDPTHPGTLQRIDFYYLRFSTNGFNGVKLDFLSHGIVEGGSNNGQHYLSSIMTGVQAYNYGMAYLAKKFGATMYMDESIAPVFPYQYAHARRVSCDTFGQIGSSTQVMGGTTSYEMNSAGYGWWLAGRLYNFNDPDQIVMEGFTSYENKSRVTSTAIQGYMLDGDDLTDSVAPGLAQQWLTNNAINGLAPLKLNFRPVDGSTGQLAPSVMVAQSGSTYYLAVFNYDPNNPLVESIDLVHAGLSGSANYKVTDLWTGATSQASGSLSVNLNPAESTIYKLQ
jgi:Alpha galactosidase C-terminal beta sandwich domain